MPRLDQSIIQNLIEFKVVGTANVTKAYSQVENRLKRLAAAEGKSATRLKSMGGNVDSLSSKFQSFRQNVVKSVSGIDSSVIASNKNVSKLGGQYTQQRVNVKL